MNEQPEYTPHTGTRTSIPEGATVPPHLEKMWMFMGNYRAQHGYAPSNREMVDAGFATSTSVVRFYYKHMEALNMIERDETIARAIRLLPRRKWGTKKEEKHENA